MHQEHVTKRARALLVSHLESDSESFGKLFLDSESFGKLLSNKSRAVAIELAGVGLFMLCFSDVLFRCACLQQHGSLNVLFVKFFRTMCDMCFTTCRHLCSFVFFA